MKNVHLLIVDPQNDFCDIPKERLPVASGAMAQPALAVPGSHADMRRLGAFINQTDHRLGGITVTLDSHPYVAIERVSFWRDADGRQVAPFTVISADSVVRGEFVPASQGELVLKQLRALEATGRNRLIVWPVHCVTGTWGHNIHDDVAVALNEWEVRLGAPVSKVLKGEYPWSEHYGAFEAEIPLAAEPSTQFNRALLDRVTHGVDLLLVAGEASSHCVATSVDQLLGALGEKAPQIVLLSDCMSPVVGCEQQEAQFLARAQQAGAWRMSTPEALDLINQ